MMKVGDRALLLVGQTMMIGALAVAFTWSKYYDWKAETNETLKENTK